MAKRITYILGAGASANAIPVVNSLTERFKFFCNHLFKVLEKDLDSSKLAMIRSQHDQLIKALESHYTIDTYAKKLFLQNKSLYTNSEYQLLIRYLSIYFIYEQLRVDYNDSTNDILNNLKNRVIDDHPHEKIAKEIAKEIATDFDYRYDSFFASILTKNEDNQLIMPENINIISWNYDFQIEKAFMNFSNHSLDDAMCSLNVTGTSHNIYKREKTDSHVIKLNGTAGFAKSHRYDDLFDFSRDFLDHRSFEIFKEILIDRRMNNQNGIRFSWENNPLSINAIELAKYKVEMSDVVVIIGYSFPYFNREIDREIFRDLFKHNIGTIYIQAPEKDVNSVIKRFEGVFPNVKPIAFTETDQFLIPNEM